MYSLNVLNGKCRRRCEDLYLSASLFLSPFRPFCPSLSPSFSLFPCLCFSFFLALRIVFSISVVACLCRLNRMNKRALGNIFASIRIIYEGDLTSSLPLNIKYASVTRKVSVLAIAKYLFYRELSKLSFFPKFYVIFMMSNIVLVFIQSSCFNKKPCG